MKQSRRSSKNIISENESPIRFAISYENPHISHATVIIPQPIVEKLFYETAKTQQFRIKTPGFSQGAVPIEYICENFKLNLVAHLKEFLFKYCVLNSLFGEIRKRKIVVSGDPRLIQIDLDPEQDARFIFECSSVPQIQIHEWRYFPFKAPKRKNYKDLDRQVDSFLSTEKQHLQSWKNTGVDHDDWISFDITILDQDNNELVENFTQNFWYCLADDEIESSIKKLFLGRIKGEEFITTDKGLQTFFSDHLETNYPFKVTVKEIIPNAYFSVDQFKRQFKIKTNKDMHKKMIEVFSYRNDISQRLAMVEEALRLLISKHQFTVPNHLVLRQQKNILHAIQNNPDYNVYRKQPDFHNQVQELAEKQVKESLFIDQFAYNENMQITHEDIGNYVNLLQRQRMKEFVYFSLPDTKRNGYEIPIPVEEIRRHCLREKAINYAIYQLTKK